MELGKFETFAFVDSRIYGTRFVHPRRRQVASILAINPSGKALCLTMSEGASKDGRLNLSPPQGGINEGESLSSAVSREIWEELQVTVSGPVRYLGSVIRTLGPNHKQAAEFDEYHHHWAAVFVSSYSVKASLPIKTASWCHFEALASVALSMSEVKREMFQTALDALFKLSGDRYLIRREALDASKKIIA